MFLGPLLVLLAWGAGTPAPSGTEDMSMHTRLPAPRIESSRSLEAALQARRSVREFTEEPLTAAEIGQLLWAAQGTTDRNGGRTAPSAGALYPLEIYAVTAAGVERYMSGEHALVRVHLTDRRDALRAAALDQDCVRAAPLTLVVTGVVARTAVKYGQARALRYVHLEAGHAAQNVLLQAVALDLGGVAVGAFDDHRVQQALDLPADHEPVYLLCIGHPRESNGSSGR